jgi:hypothetical protein
MSATHASPATVAPTAPISVASIWRSMTGASPALAWTGGLLLLCSCVTALLPLVDARLFQGVSVWLKPWKFQFSVGTYLLTLAFFLAWLPALPERGLAKRFVVWAGVVGGLFEVIYITWQGALGQASHFNLSTPVYATLYTLMAIGALALNTTTSVLGVCVLRSSAWRSSRPMRHAIGWGLIITSVLGTITGFYLGGRATAGGHWVGGSATDAGGLAIFHWSRDGGDLRVAHFFAIHAMHFLPVLGWMLSAKGVSTKLSETWRTRWIWAGALLFCAVCVATFVQALRGRPFL